MAMEVMLRHDERSWERWLIAAAAAALLVTFFCVMAAFNVTAHGGVDQNGYLVGGKVLARHGTGGLSVMDRDTGQVDPYQFVGRMWIGADLGTQHERYYPKYPPGLSLWVAIGWWLGVGPTFAYWVNPVCMTLGLGATFLVARLIAGSGPALLAMAVVATSPAIMGLTINPNSHAGALCFVTWGMYFVLQWTRRGGVLRAAAAGLCLGMAVTFRYTEGLMALPAAIAVVLALPGRSLRSWLEAAAMGAAWLTVVGAMVAYNYASFGLLTGYDPTNESTGFAWAFFVENWTTMLHSLDGPGLFMVFPIAVAGMIGLLFWRWRVGLVMCAWVVPSLLLYTAYYWAPSSEGLGYTRFFVTQFPALATCAAAAGAMLIGGDVKPQAISDRTIAAGSVRVGWTFGGGAIAMLAALANVESGVQHLKVDQINRLNLHHQAQLILAQAPSGSVIISRDAQLLHHLQFQGEYKLYDLQQFDAGFIQQAGQVMIDEPQGLQPQRKLAVYARLKDAKPDELNREQLKLVNGAILQGQRVFIVQPWRSFSGKDREQFGLWRTLPAKDYDTKLIATWDRLMTDNLTDPARPAPRHRWAGARPNFRSATQRGMLVEVLAKPIESKDALAGLDQPK